MLLDADLKQKEKDARSFRLTSMIIMALVVPAVIGSLCWPVVVAWIALGVTVGTRVSDSIGVPEVMPVVVMVTLVVLYLVGSAVVLIGVNYASHRHRF